jgi:hypothetical protein
VSILEWINTGSFFVRQYHFAEKDIHRQTFAFDNLKSPARFPLDIFSAAPLD